MVKLFTMVKDEVDIVRDWVIYHGCLFGWDNIYVIDNYSTDGTYEELLEFKNLIHITRKIDYKKKGKYMQKMIAKYAINTIAFPIDIDEFVVYYNINDKIISVDKELINNYINNLEPCSVYKANYLYPILPNPIGYNRSTIELDYSDYCDMGNLAKSFINTKYFNGIIDHGNHIPCNNYKLTNIVLLHFHNRSIEQIKKKVKNNVIGLGYSLKTDDISKITDNSPGALEKNGLKLKENWMKKLSNLCRNKVVQVKIGLKIRSVLLST